MSEVPKKWSDVAKLQERCLAEEQSKERSKKPTITGFYWVKLPKPMIETEIAWVEIELNESYALLPGSTSRVSLGSFTEFVGPLQDPWASQDGGV